MEEDVYRCGWKQHDDGFEVWTKRAPRVRARGKTFAEAEAALLDAIADAFGVHFAVLEFTPLLPPPELDKKYSTPEIYTICGDERFEADEPRRIWFETAAERFERESWHDQFFVAHCCRSCRTPGGPRNDTQLRLTYVRKAYDGGFVILAGAWMRIFSERFLELLSPDERERLEFRPVECLKKARRKFFELVGPAGPPEVALAGRALTGWCCPVCDARVFGHDYSPDRSIHKYVSRSDLPNPLPQIFTIGVQNKVELCVVAERWATMVKRMGTRGFCSSPVGVVDDDEVVRAPDLKPLTTDDTAWEPPNERE